MALRALEPQAEEELRGVFELLLRLLHLAIPGDRRILVDLAGGGEDLADELVVRLVRVQAVADPGVEGEVAGRVARLRCACCAAARSICSAK